MKFSQKIALLRKQKGLSQDQVADELDVSRQSVYKWEAGVSTPEVGKIKKMAQMFDVSLDVLLDDSVGLEQHSSVSVQKTEEANKSTLGYRAVFSSAHKLSYDHADVDHGYTESRNAYCDGAWGWFKTFDHAHREEMKALGYSQIEPLQEDLCAYFFVDEKKKVFGFYYDHAEQFVCPFENILDVQITNSGMSLERSYQPTGGLVLGANSGFWVGRRAVDHLERPRNFALSVSYYTPSGKVDVYRIDTTVFRRSYVYDPNIPTVNHSRIVEDAAAEKTMRSLELIKSKILGLKKTGKEILNGEVKAIPFRAAEYQPNVGKGDAKRKNWVKEIEKDVKKQKKDRLVTRLVVIGGVCIVAAIVLLIALL